MSKEYCTPLDIREIERNFSDIHPPLTVAEAAHESNRCLYCFDTPCMHACPTHIDVPGFIKKIASGNLLGSARVIFDANPIGATCARVCPVEVLCEGACVEKTLLNKPIEIGRLQRYATDLALANDTQIFTNGPYNGKSVGIIGAGPAGISCAAYLTRLGYSVTIYEREPLAGGLDTYGMAEYKMPQSVSLGEVDRLKKMGVDIRTNTEIVGPQTVASPHDPGLAFARIVFDDLLSAHDSIFIATGLGQTNRLNIPGEQLDRVYDALDFIRKIKTREWQSIPLGRTVVVIGAGNTAVDAVTQAKRLGAERVIMLYRRKETDAPAYDYEMELAKKDGIEFIWQAAPIGLLSEDGEHVSGVRCERADGSLELFEVECDMVIKAVGQQKMRGFFETVIGVKLDEKGRVEVNEAMQTSRAKVFAGGDCVNGGSEAVDAAQMGKLAARGIHELLSGERVDLAGIRPPVLDLERTHQPHN